MRATEFIIIREVATDDLRLTRIVVGYKPPPDPAYTWGGPFKSRQAASKALHRKNETLRKQLYPEA